MREGRRERTAPSRDGLGEDRDGRAARKPYAPPRLVVYGSLAQLTRGGFGTRVDGGSGRTGNRGRGRGGL